MGDYLSLDDAAKLIPGATADTLKRLHRKGLLQTYRVGKPLFTTRADLNRMIELCKIKVQPLPAMRVSAIPNGLGLTEADLTRMALDRALERLDKDKAERRRLREEERERTRPERVRVAKEKRRSRARRKYQERKAARK